MYSGIPQGSVLGLILFLIYVNDIPSCVQSKIKLFADDTKLWRVLKSKNDHDILQADLDTLGNWSDSWLLCFHVGKCKCMLLGNNNEEWDYSMKEGNVNKVMQKTDVEKDLDV